MTPRLDSLEQFAPLLVGPDSPALGERTLEVVMALVNGRSAGVFATGDDRLTLLASRGIDQYVLDAADAIWLRGKGDLRRGRAIYVPDCRRDDALAAVTAGGPASLAVLPVIDGEALVAVLYVDSVEPDFCEGNDLERLVKFSTLLAPAVRPEESGGAASGGEGWQAYLERTSVEDIEREKLLLLLNRNEWNIARVARLMGVTRRTIYLRLQRYNIPRERVSKSRPGRELAS
jgi:regulatory Fis family protein/GAF domain-containing protein